MKNCVSKKDTLNFLYDNCSKIEEKLNSVSDELYTGKTFSREELLSLNCDISSIIVIINKIANVIDKWMYLFGSNTVFALEYYPALSAMLTDAYCGAYINNQKTIEKVVGNTLVSYTKNVIAKGGTLV